eukprot:GFYU01005420.1.p1 GENE.GFYU01005420.1~~GFYU01005420.1.p1  ORF type:complete len:292 (-),score=44.89 GFYU01005420.1:70-945(-)
MSSTIDQAEQQYDVIDEPLKIALLVTGTVFGIVICFFGQRFLRFAAFCFGFTFGAVFVGFIAFEASDGDHKATLIAGGAVGLVLGMICLCILKVGKFVIGAGVGLLGVLVFVEMGVAKAIGSPTMIWVVGALISLACGFLCIKLFNTILIVATAYGGAFAVALAISPWVDGHLNLFRIIAEPESVVCDRTPCILLWVGWALLGSLGLYVQLKYTRKKEAERNAIEEDTPLWRVWAEKRKGRQYSQFDRSKSGMGFSMPNIFKSETERTLDREMQQPTHSMDNRSGRFSFSR